MFTTITLPDALFSCLFIAHFLAGLLFMAWLWHLNRRAPWHTKVSMPPNHLRDRSGFCTPELMQAILGIGLMITLGLIMAASLADDPRW